MLRCLNWDWRSIQHATCHIQCSIGLQLLTFFWGIHTSTTEVRCEALEPFEQAPASVVVIPSSSCIEPGPGASRCPKSQQEDWSFGGHGPQGDQWNRHDCPNEHIHYGRVNIVLRHDDNVDICVQRYVFMNIYIYMYDTYNIYIYLHCIHVHLYICTNLHIPIPMHIHIYMCHNIFPSFASWSFGFRNRLVVSRNLFQVWGVWKKTRILSTEIITPAHEFGTY